MLRRFILLFAAIAMMALMMGASIVPAVAAPGDQSANVIPHQCVEFSAEETGCFHVVETPSGISNNQFQTRGPFFEHEPPAQQGTAKVPGEFVGHSTIAPSGNFNTIFHVNPTEQ